MADYQPPANDLASYLVTENICKTGEVFVAMAPEWRVIPSTTNVITVVKPTNGIANPKWLHDQWFITFQTFGRDRSQTEDAEKQIWAVFNHLIGASNFTLTNQLYRQFNSTVMPRLVGYLDNAQPIYSTTLSMYVDAQEDIGSRIALC
jgi:hypothetical protein